MAEKQTEQKYPIDRPTGWEEQDGDAIVPKDLGEFEELPYPDELSAMESNMQPLVAAAETESAEPTEQEKMIIVHEALGFYPTNTRELSEAIALIDQIYLHGKFGTAKHLNERLLHQENHGAKDPPAAVRSAIRTYIDFAKRSRSDWSNLVQLNGEVGDNTGNGAKPAKELLHTGLGQFVRAVDLRIYTGEATGSSFLAKLYVPEPKNRAFDPYIPTQPSDPYKKRISEVMESVDVRTVGFMLEGFIDEQKSRYYFWIDRIKDAQNHLSAKAIASEALKDLGINA